jgi:uncharacterized membrane protein YjfL (UPF0719 family)
MLDMIANSLIFGTIGAVLMFLFGWFFFDKLTPRIDFSKELVENKNIAVAIVIGAFLLGIAHIVAAVVEG